MQQLHLGKVEIGNTESRRVELAAAIEVVFERMQLPRIEAFRLKERM